MSIICYFPHTITLNRINIFKYLHILKNSYRVARVDDTFGGKYIKIHTLMEFLIFAKKFDLANQLGEPIPENNHKGINYFHKK